MPDVFTLAMRFRARLLKREAKARAELLRAYNDAFEKVEEELAAVLGEIAKDGEVSIGKVFRADRLSSLKKQIEEEIDKLADKGTSITKRLQNLAASEAATDALQMMNAVAKSARLTVRFDRLAKSAITQFIGMAQDGSVLKDSFDSLAKQMKLESGDVLKKAITQGIALGENPRRIASRIRKGIDAKDGNPMSDPKVVRRLHTSVRTSTLNSYRESSRETYKENSNVVKGWRWTSARTSRTCVVCWAMDGEIFPTDTPMGTHINCRCVLVPVIDGIQLTQKDGQEAFAELEPGVQKQILGPKAFEAYQRGDVKLKDFVGVRVDDRWGTSRGRISLEDARKRRTTKAGGGGGAGGNWKRFNERHEASVVKQKNDVSCVSAVGEMLAKDFGMKTSQAKILKAIGSPSNATTLADYLNKIDKDKKWVGGFSPLEIKLIRPFTEARKSWGAILREGSPMGHAVLIHGVDEKGRLKIKDPFDQTMYEMTVEDLHEVLSELVFKE